MTFLALALTFTSGGLGAYARYRLDRKLKQLFSLPLSTFIINLLGSFTLGISLVVFRNQDLLYLVAVGFCGGFTTFSTAMLEAVSEARARRPGWFWLLLVGQVFTALLALWVGMLLGANLTP